MYFVCKFLKALNVGLVEWKLYFCVAWYHSCEIMIFVTQGLGAYVYSVIRPRGVNIGNRRLIDANMKRCQIRAWIVEEIFNKSILALCVCPFNIPARVLLPSCYTKDAHYELLYFLKHTIHTLTPHVSHQSQFVSVPPKSLVSRGRHVHCSHRLTKKASAVLLVSGEHVLAAPKPTRPKHIRTFALK